MPIDIRPARLEDSAALTDISFCSKKYWDYPDSYFDTWRDELTISSDYIQQHTVFVASDDDRAIGYYSLVNIQQPFWAGSTHISTGTWLEHMFILPDYIGQGLGRRLMEHASHHCKQQAIKRVKILADPHATGFYQKLGVRFVEEVPSNIEGRNVAYLEWDIV